MAKGGHAWPGGVRGEGGMRGKGGACVVKGVCVAKGGMHGKRGGKGGHVWYAHPPALLRDTAGQCAGGTYPTGMHSCYNLQSLNIQYIFILLHLQEAQNWFTCHAVQMVFGVSITMVWYTCVLESSPLVVVITGT